MRRARERYTEAFDRYAKTLEQLALRNGGQVCGRLHLHADRRGDFGSLVRARGLG